MFPYYRRSALMWYLLLGGRWLGLLLGLLALITVVVFAIGYRERLNQIIEYHNGYKRFLYLLTNAVNPSSEKLSERYIRNLAQRLGIKIYKLSAYGKGYRLVIENLPASKVIPFLAGLEKAGKVERFEMTDNTGEGNFYTTVVVSITY